MTIKNKIRLSAFSFITLVVLMVVFLISPLLEEIKRNSQEIVSQKESLVALEDKITKLEGFKILYQDLELFLEQIESLFINREVPVDFIRFLEKQAKESQIKIEVSPGFSGKIEKDLWPSLTFQISSIGSFPNFSKFLEKIENSSYLIEIQNLNISRSTDREDSSTAEVKANFLIKVYTQ